MIRPPSRLRSIRQKLENEREGFQDSRGRKRVIQPSENVDENAKISAASREKVDPEFRRHHRRGSRDQVKNGIEISNQRGFWAWEFLG
jgi:hypothetical protein